MSKLADDLCAEVRRQCDQAEHFKGLWMQSSDELEKVRKQRDKLLEALVKIDAAAKESTTIIGFSSKAFRMLGEIREIIAEARGDK